MVLPENKKVVCITGSVWTGSRRAPRRLLLKDGFLRPTWFTTGRQLTDAQYRRISTTEFHMAKAENNVLAALAYGGDFIGIMREEFESAAITAEEGVLVVGPPEIAAQIAAQIPRAFIFSLKDTGMMLSEHLADASNAGQLHRIDVDALEPGAWMQAYRSIAAVVGLAVRVDPI